MINKAKQEKRSLRGMQPLAYAIKPITKKTFGKKLSTYGELITQWPVIMDGFGFKNIHPIKLQFPKKQNHHATLTLSASSSQAFTLQHSSELLIKKINQFFGYQIVGKVQFIHDQKQSLDNKENTTRKTKKRGLSPKEMARLEKDLDYVTDPSIKKALVALGKSVIDRDQNHS